MSQRKTTRHTLSSYLLDTTLGSPSSNPWVSLFDNHLNFRESVTFPGPREFINKKPTPAERDRYRAFPWTGSAGEEYATISLVPTESRRGNVLILQGLHQEGTESAGNMVTTAAGQQKLKSALGLEAKDETAVWFEVLIRARAAAGTTRATEVVATRIWRDPAGH